VNSFAPPAVIPVLTWVATALETIFGVALVIGFKGEYARTAQPFCLLSLHLR
jgi:uncharacterized membrane protein YphA (DoxX/SURF4 family)